jgi:hypothetical protein
MTLLRPWFVLLSAQLWAAEPDAVVVDTAPATRYSYSLENLFYSSRSVVRHDGFYNPDNSVVNYPLQWSVADLRGKWRVDEGQQTLLLQARLRWQERVFEHEATAYQDSAARHDATDSNLDQAFWRWSGGANTLLLGREVFTWGLRPFARPAARFILMQARLTP